MKKVTTTELARGLSDFINRATYRKEEFLITREGKPVAALSPVPAGVRVRDLADTLARLPSLETDDIERMNEDLSEVRDYGSHPLIDSWESF